MRPQDIAERIRDRYADVTVARGEATVILERDDLLEALAWLRHERVLAFDFLSCLTATDWPDREPRLWVAYELYSMTHTHRLRAKVGLSEGDAHVPTVTGLFPTADWLERETFDFYGIVFEGHPNLRRILLPDDWEGHPLLKTEELGGVNTSYRGAFIPPIDTRTVH